MEFQVKRNPLFTMYGLTMASLFGRLFVQVELDNHYNDTRKVSNGRQQFILLLTHTSVIRCSFLVFHFQYFGTVLRDPVALAVAPGRC